MRNMISNSIVAKFEGHSSNLQSLCFVDKQQATTYDFVSSAGSENLYWQTPEAVTSNNNQTQIHEVLQPAKILDCESTQAVNQI